MILIAAFAQVATILCFQFGTTRAFRPTQRNYRLRSLQAVDSIHAIGDIGSQIAASMPIFHSKIDSFLGSTPSSSFLLSAEEAVSVYSKVDKTGFIGFIADGIEKVIDFGHETLQRTGLQATYGYSIIAFTIFVKIVTLPLVKTQIESTSKLQKLTPLQQKIQAKYANDEQTKNQVLSQLYQAANANPLAGCLPALVQIPVFISLYRALQNLVAENKLDEPFLWIPDLEGPVYMKPPGESMDWIKSAFSGNPELGWSDTLAFASLPVLLFISQSISQKVLQPPKDPKKELTEQEQVSQGILNYLPFMIAFFSVNVPAGLGIYWVFNNFLTTIVTLAVKNQFKDDQLPPEVAEIMAMVDGTSSVKSGNGRAASLTELKGSAAVMDRPKKGGFGTISNTIETLDDLSKADEETSSLPVIDAEVVVVSPAEPERVSEESGDDNTDKKRKSKISKSKKDKKKNQ